MPALVRPLLHDRIDIIGDVHGELGALRSLLARLGCDVERARVERPLVFVGDLVDRGPDSVAVVQLVQHLVEQGAAQLVLGNHELNLLLGDAKEGNGWFLQHEQPDGFHEAGQHVPFASRVATERERVDIARFLESLPIALESPALRIVHAAWVPEAIEGARAAADLAAFLQQPCASTVSEALRDAPSAAALRDPVVPVAFHPQLAAQQAHEQNGSPLKILTSGLERPLTGDAQPMYLGGKWRMLERDPWWERDHDPRDVVFGHYWRRRPGARIVDKPDLLDGVDPCAWFGAEKQAFCVDYSVGRRYKARHRGEDPARHYALAALRWPEGTLYFDDEDAARSTSR